MKCPFELSVYSEEFIGAFDSMYCVRDPSGELICDNLLKVEADYIVQAINSHEKLVQYKDYVESRISECSIPNEWLPMCYEEWNNAVEELAKELEQALKEAKKK